MSTDDRRLATASFSRIAAVPTFRYLSAYSEGSPFSPHHSLYKSDVCHCCFNMFGKSYREPDGSPLPVLNIQRFEIKPAEQVALIGQSGGGKTTLLNVVSGITAVDSGLVQVDGVDVSKLPEVSRDRFRAERIGIVFQTFNLLPRSPRWRTCCWA
ncbi:MAG: ATP-binding cassette domain-containing protein [Planctomycetaceae bacterium]